MISINDYSRCFYGSSNYDIDNKDKVKRISSQCESVKSMFLNDNTVLKIIYDFALSNGVVPSDLDITAEQNMPDNVKVILAKLREQVPAVADVWKTDEDAIRFVRSRYAQYGEELSLIHI